MAKFRILVLIGWYPRGEAPQALEQVASKIRDADGFIFVVGEYNWGVQPGLKNLTDHFLEEWFWRPAAIASFRSPVRCAVRNRVARHTMRNGDGRSLQHDIRWPHRSDSVS